MAMPSVSICSGSCATSQGLESCREADHLGALDAADLGGLEPLHPLGWQAGAQLGAAQNTKAHRLALLLQVSRKVYRLAHDGIGAPLSGPEVAHCHRSALKPHGHAYLGITP